MGTMSIMDSTGDTKLVWDPKEKTEVETARKAFQALLDKGFVAFRVAKEGGKGEKIKEFDPLAGSIIMVPKLVGG